MMKQVQKMQAEMVAAQDALAPRRPSRAVGRRRHGEGRRHRDRRPASITISPEVVDPDDIEMLQDLVVAAVTEAIAQAQALQSEQMGGVTGGLDLGSLGGLLG